MSSLIPFIPSGVNAYKHFAAENNLKYGEHSFNYYKSIGFSNYGSDRLFRDWLYADYGAEIVRVNHEHALRFINEHQKLTFLLTWASP